MCGLVNSFGASYTSGFTVYENRYCCRFLYMDVDCIMDVDAILYFNCIFILLVGGSCVCVCARACVCTSVCVFSA